MAANLAVKAFQVAVPKVTDFAAKNLPAVAARAKQMVAQATGIPVERVNLGQVASANGGANAQLVAESLVRSGMKVEDIFQHVPTISGVEMTRLRDHFTALEKAARAESDALVAAVDKTPSIHVDVAVQTQADNIMFSDAMRLLGITNIDDLHRVKIALDHLDSNKVAVYTAFNRGGRPMSRSF